MAFQQADGKVAWAKGNIPNAYSSPLLINLDGLEQLVLVMNRLVFGLNPHNGDLQWQVPFKADYGISVATPVWCPGNLLFVSAEYGAGSKMIRLSRNGMQTRAEEVWSSTRLRLHTGNAMWLDGALYFTSGGKGSQAILSAVDAASGKILWQERSIQKATFVWADRKLITLSEDGTLMLANASAKGFQVVARSELLTSLSWTPPVLVGTRLYIRDRKSIMAVELG
jgi:outer membrane protein assembly factor BamB